MLPLSKSAQRKKRCRDFFYRLFHYFAVCKCFVCGELIANDRVLCEDCEDGYRAALLSECGICAKPLCRCLCADDRLVKRGVRKHVKLYRYVTDDFEAVGNQILYRLKTQDIAGAFRFFGAELARITEALLPFDENDVITFVPRTAARRLACGFDQSENLAKEMSYATGLPLLKLLTRGQKGKVQKKMKSTEERFQNAKDSLFVKKKAKAQIKGKRIFLIDDLITSGATVCAAAKVLRQNGAKEIIAVSLGVVTRTRNLRAEAEKNSRLPFYMR